MITPDMLIKAFCELGDKEVVPDADANGYVNFTQGYTPYYELSLKSGNPQAKPVDRKTHNYLFWALTNNALAWQSQLYPPWYSGKAYGRNSVVMRVGGDGVARPYRSLVNNNSADPLTSSNWDYVMTSAETKALIAMPAGGGGTEVFTGPVNLNELTYSGTFEFLDDSVAQGSANIPVPVGASSAAGMLEVKQWGSIVLQRYTDRNGSVYTRSYNGSSWTPWRNLLTVESAQYDTIRYGVIGGSVNAYTLNLSPAPSALIDGMEVRGFISADTNSGASTFNLNGLGARSILGGAYAALKGGEFVSGAMVTLRWYAGANVWVITGSAGGRMQIFGGYQSDHAVNLAQLTAAVNPAPAANKLQNARLINLYGDTNGAAWFDGTGDINIITDTAYADNAGKWQNARTINLGGMLSGSISLDGSADANFNAQITGLAGILGDSGQVSIPTTGGTFILKWFTTGVLGPQSYNAISYHNGAFPNACRGVWAQSCSDQGTSGSDSNRYNCGTINKTASGFTLINDGAASAFFVLALGH